MNNMLPVSRIKKDFPIFKIHPNLGYLDSTATSLKPKFVTDAVLEYYNQYCANVHRGIYAISEKATKEYEKARQKVAAFVGADRSEEIIFTRSTTESINLVAYALGREIVSKGDEIVTTIMEHHSNFVPWQQLALECGAVFKVIDVTDSGILFASDGKTPGVGISLTPGVKEEQVDLRSVITKKTKILAITYVSNVLGVINPIHEIIKSAKKINPKLIIVIDAAQAAPHHKIAIGDLGCDFLVFSGHKMCGPTGIGVLWGKYELLERMSPFNFGGEMIKTVTSEKTTFNTPPYKFEAGTPNIAGAIGLGAAIDYLERIGLENIARHEKRLARLVIKRLREEFGDEIRVLGDARDRVGVVAFEAEFGHSHDIAQLLDERGLAVRAGHHCAMPLHKRLGAVSSTRASFYLYNGEKDVEKLINGLKYARKLLQ